MGFNGKGMEWNMVHDSHSQSVWLVGQSISQSVYVGVGRCQCRSHTLGLQICQAQFFASRSLRPQFISGPIGIIMSAMLFLEDLINSPTTGPNRL